MGISDHRLFLMYHKYTGSFNTEFSFGIEKQTERNLSFLHEDAFIYNKEAVFQDLFFKESLRDDIFFKKKF